MYSARHIKFLVNIGNLFQQHSLNPGNGPPPPSMMPMGPGGAAGPDGIPVTAGPHPMFYSAPHFGPRPFGPRPSPLRNMSQPMVRVTKIFHFY